MTVLATTNLTHRVGVGATARTLYENLSAEFAPGTFYAVVGPNGAGKTTLLRDLVGIGTPSGGSVNIDNRTLNAVTPQERAKTLAYLPQQTPLYYDLTVAELVMLGRAPHLGRMSPPGVDDEERVNSALAQVGIDTLKARGVLSLSGGERQRVMLARMLATDAPVWLLDEPTTALDIGHALAFLDLCQQLIQSGKTLIMAMHDLELARRYASYVLCLGGDGSCLAGTPDEIITPQIVGEVFGVEVAEQSRGVLFFPKSASEADE